MSDVVVVESPAKAKTINKYLGGGYTVLASFGHVRDLPPKDGSVRPEQDFAMDWAADDRGDRQVNAIAKALKGAKTLYLATDPDREGEAISWHVQGMLADKGALKGIKVERITFNEITRNAVRYAMAHPRALDQPLIEAYLARRALDYLVGFTLSPVLWRKLPGSRSAGRVQSVALRLICEREAEIEAFRPREYWTVEAQFTTPAGAPFTARLTHLNGKRLDQFDLNTAALANAAKDQVEAGTFSVASVERKRVKRNPPAPFTTSTLQQEASRKMSFGAQQTMRVAQSLYEGVEIDGDTVGLITYMRTDGVQMAREAIDAIRGHVHGAYGAPYLPAAPREYVSKAKNAQEAHEAIRPVDVALTPENAAKYLNPDQRRLYDLIWKRAVASQMQSAELDQVTVEVADPAKPAGPRLRATGSILAFDGFLKLYHEDQDDAEEEAENKMLPPMAEKDPLRRGGVAADQHFTQPPPRYSEASLVKKMEELGIGRPSTYASILTVLQDRNYVKLDRRRFVPEDRGRLVTAFLKSFFERYVDTGFTAGLEEQLDDISGGRLDWRAVMRAFWDDFSKAIDQTKDLKISDVINALDEDLGPHFFPSRDDGSDPRVCTACGTGRLGLKLGRHGSFIGCSNYPACQYTRRLAVENGEEGGETLKEGMRELGHHPDSGETITVRRGPYGLYVQQGEQVPDSKTKPRRTSLPRGVEGDTLTLEQALGLLSLPRLVGLHPESGEKMEAGIGRFGPYIKMGGVFASLDKDDDVLTVGVNRAVDVLAKKLASVRALGPHPKGGEPILVRKGRFGPYAQHGNMVANLPRDVMMDDITVEQAVALLAEKGKMLKPRGAKKGGKPARAARPAAKPPAGPEMAAQPAKAATKKKAAPKKKAPAKKKPRSKRLPDRMARAGGLPSRDDIKRFIQESPGRVGKREIARHFGLGPEHAKGLRGLLKSLSGEGAVAPAGHRRFAAPGRLPDAMVVQITGTDPDGDAVAKPVGWEGEGRPPVIYMAAEARGRPALAPGERVLARLKPIGAGKYEGRTLKRLTDTPGRVLGVYRPGPHGDRLIPTDKRAKAEWVIPPGESGGAEPDEIVLAAPLPSSGFGLKQARIIERLGPMGDARSVSLVVIHTHDIPTEFSPEALAEAERARAVTVRGRTDLRALPLITIDGEDARDFDDAVHAEPDGDGFVLTVAIADVSHYVRPGSALDRTAWTRGNSCYFPDRVVPMLPEALSNGWCSLRPDEERGVLYVHMWIDSKGQKTAHKFGRGLMRSAARLTYEQVQAAHDAGETLDLPLAALYAAYRALLGARQARGTLDLDLPERKVVLGDDGHVASVAPRPRLDSHRLIEEFMVLANVCAAEELERLHAPCVYRVHAPPSEEKLENLRSFLHGFGFSLPPATRSTRATSMASCAASSARTKPR